MYHKEREVYWRCKRALVGSFWLTLFQSICRSFCTPKKNN